MKDLKEIVENQINEDKFAYSWQNAFIHAIISLNDVDGEVPCREIVEKWFDDEQALHELYTFLYRIDCEPKNKNVKSIVEAIVNKASKLKTYKI
mgnify:CR=1 FL=1